VSFNRIKAFASAMRDLFALAFTPVVTVMSIWLICILAYGNWTADTQQQRLNYIGAISIIAIILVGVGGQWFQRNRVTALKGTGPGGVSFDIATAPDDDNKPTGQVTNGN
jgi:hypothetical protein